MTDGIDHIRQALLPATTVRVSVAGQFKGTGFFVAPGILVTCRHVLQLLDLSDADSLRSIGIEGLEGEQYAVRSIREVSPREADDLVVLRVAPGHDHPCTLLMTGLNAGEEVHAFGYTAKHLEGIPATYEAIGLTGDQTLFKLKEGQAEPGMSGCPVLNVRTGAVCGVLRRTVNPQLDLGGYMIPLPRLIGLSEAIATENRIFHTRNPEWFELLPAASRQTWGGKPASDPTWGMPEEVLVVSVHQLEDWWEVRAVLHPVGQTFGPEQVDLNTVRLEVARLFRDWASPDLSWRGRVARGEELRLLGGVLSSAVLPKSIGSEVERLLSPRRSRWVEVALRFEDETAPDLQYLPWEHLYLPPRGEFGESYVAREPEMAFTRAIKAQPRADEPRIPRELNSLFVSAQPEGETFKDVAREVRAVVADAVELLENTERIRCERVDSPDVNTLAERVNATRPDILHYVGFGQFDGVDRLAMCRSDGSHEYIDVATFRLALRPAPRVVVLQLCEPPSTVMAAGTRAELFPVRADLAPFAPPLLAKGVEAVVAYQYPSDASAAMCFNKHFYRRVTSGAAVEMAVQAARTALHLKDPEERAFLAPTVSVREPGGLRLATDDPEFAQRSWVGAASAYG